MNMVASSSNPLQCHSCGSREIDYDNIGTERSRVCKNCGVVIGDMVSHNMDKAFNEHTVYVPNDSHWTRSGAAGSKSNVTLFRRKSFRTVKRLTKTLCLPSDIQDQALNLLKQLYKHLKSRYFQGEKLVAAGCIFIVCRQNGVTIFLKDIAQKIPFNESAISNMSKKICRELNLTLAIPEPTIAEHMEIISSKIPIKDFKIKQLATEIVQFCVEVQWLDTGRLRPPLIGAAAYLALKSSDSPKANIDAICKDCKISTGIFMKRRREIEDVCMNCIKFLPWIKQDISRKKIAHYLPKIIKYKEVIKHSIKEKADAQTYAPISFAQNQRKSLENRKAIKEVKESLLLNGEEVNEEDLWKTLKGIHTNPGEHNEAVIKLLLAHGYSEDDLADGYYESRLCQLMPSSSQNGEELGQEDIAEEEMHNFLKSAEEVQKLKVVGSMPKVHKKNSK
ncbi:Transcription factor IIIB 50 kDa subunit [Trichoplax sp. H2]|nr:Transcription factor IIIB 50 kDa subunit [Trichoplax sp. H2]|eukprot:RDD36970.1 Transcription factor IIIB 50 kDa subunit [Trichoplax sp. H2]